MTEKRQSKAKRRAVINIRKGRQEEIEQAIVLGRGYYAEADMKAMHFDEDKGRALCAELLNIGLGIVAEIDGKLVGMMGARIFNEWFSDTPMARDVMIYIDPEYRGLGVGRSLVNVYINWALEQGIRPENIYIGIDSGIHTKKTENIYKSLGFRRSGITMRLQQKD